LRSEFWQKEKNQRNQNCSQRHTACFQRFPYSKKIICFQVIKRTPQFIMQSYNSKILMLKAYRFNYERLKSRGAFEAANAELERIDELSNELYQGELVARISSLEKKNLKAESEHRISLLNQQNLIKEESITNQRKIQNVLLGLLAFAIISVWLLWRLFSERNSSNKILTTKNSIISEALEENKFLVKEVHHRVKNNLQVISSLLNLQSRQLDSFEAKEAIQTSRSRVMAMSLLHQNVYGNEDLKTVNIKKYFADLLENLEATYDLSAQNIFFDSNIESLELDIDIIVPIGLISNELITNAFKHAFKEAEGGTITVNLKKEERFLLLTIADNGKGVPFDVLPKKSKSLGFKLITSFRKQLDAEFLIRNESGSEFILKIPMN